jgi:CRP/FNR family transcriptional regulator, cyclic AMP receptor protein
MASDLNERRFSDGETIVKEGDSGEEMFIIRTGRVRIFKASNAQEVTLAILSPGDYFGEMALMGDYERSATAAAAGDVTVAVVDRETFKSYIKEPIVLEIMGRMAHRIRELDKDVFRARVAESNRRSFVEGRMEQRHWFT